MTKQRDLKALIRDYQRSHPGMSYMTARRIVTDVVAKAPTHDAQTATEVIEHKTKETK